MENLVTLCLFLLHLLASTYSQRVAPGVPPQQYQQAPPPQQYQQVPQQQHYQQVPVQHQVPVQQQHQQPQYQQHATVQQQGHGASQGHHQGHPQQLLNTANIAHEKQHIQDHLDVPIDTSKMTEQELQFHYFKMHDADNNNKLDGCELIKSLIHWHEQGHKNPQQTVVPQEKLFKDEELINLIDPILSMDDANNDGYIDYPEFIQAQQKAAARPGP